jgi:hypothetical protein
MQNAYPNPGKYDKMIPVATFNVHTLGLPHKAKSTSKIFYKGEQVPRSNLATWNNMHPYGNSFDPHRGTTYSSHHSTSKEVLPAQQWSNYDPQLIKSEGKFDTEYRTKLADPTKHELAQENYCHCDRKKKLH